MIRAAVIIFFASWIPLLVAGGLFGMDNPIGLGLLAWAGSALGIAIGAIGAIVAVYRFFTGGSRDGV